MNRSLLEVSLVVFSISAGSCNHSSPPDLPETLPIRSIHIAAPFAKDTYSVEELLVSPQSFAHSVVTVSGCYEGGFEMSDLTAGQGRSGLIWVEDAGSIEEPKKLSRYLREHGELDESIGIETYLGSKELLLAYDERRNSRAWHRLHTLGSEVVLLGQFETSEHGFGHLNAYPSELILIDVLSKEPTAKRQKSR